MQLSKDIFEEGLAYSSSAVSNLTPDDSYEGLLNELINRRMSKEEFGVRAMEMAERKGR